MDSQEFVGNYLNHLEINNCNFEELKKNIDEDMKVFFFNFEKIKTILADEIIVIDENEKPKQKELYKLYNYFYIPLIINKDNLVNIVYKFDFINIINNDNEMSEKPLRKIIISKIIIDLINLYEN